MNIRRRKLKIAEKRTRHELIVMLSGVNEDVFDRFISGAAFARAYDYVCVVPVNCTDYRRSLHEIRARTND
jgi:hypothetical protein